MANSNPQSCGLKTQSILDTVTSNYMHFCLTKVLNCSLLTGIEGCLITGTYLVMSISVGPPLWPNLKHLNSYWNDCHEIWYRPMVVSGWIKDLIPLTFSLVRHLWLWERCSNNYRNIEMWYRYPCSPLNFCTSKLWKTVSMYLYSLTAMRLKKKKSARLDLLFTASEDRCLWFTWLDFTHCIELYEQFYWQRSSAITASTSHAEDLWSNPLWDRLWT